MFQVLNSLLGLAMGNMGIYIPAVVLLAWFWFSISNKFRNIKVRHTYSSKEKGDVLQYLAFNLLLARDGRYNYLEQKKL